MATKTTKNIEINVETFYNEAHSRPREGKHIFAYRITIRNKGNHTVQLLRRHWQIIDFLGEREEVEGAGVVGQQPVLSPGETHQYVSWCPLKSDMGKMVGTYLMKRLPEEDTFLVEIPAFLLMANYRKN